MHVEAVCDGSCVYVCFYTALFHTAILANKPHTDFRRDCYWHVQCLQNSGASKFHVHLQHVQGKYLGGP